MAFLHSDSTAVDVSASAPNATNYIDMLHKLIQFAVNESVATSALNAAGTGYAVGDIFEIDGGTHPSTLANARATFEVLTLSGSAIATFRIRDAGSYTVAPGTTGIATTALSGGGSGATLDLTYASNGWTVDRQTQEAASAVISAGGSGYNIGDDIETLGGDTRVGFDAPQTETPGLFNVDAVSSGAITTLSVVSGGTYHRAPANPASTVLSTGTGDNLATLTVTYSAIIDTTTDIEVWMTSTAGASVGIRSYTNTTSVFNWEIASAPLYTDANDFEAQVNMTVGRYPDNDTGSYCVLRDIAFNYYMRVTDRGINCVFNVDNGIYSSIHISLLNPYATGTEYDYPMLVVGSSSQHDFNILSTNTAWLGMNAAVAENDADNGPAQVFTPGGSWIPFHNGYNSGGNILGVNATFHLIPGGNFETQDSLIEEADRIASNNTNSEKQDWGSFASIATATSAGGEDAPTERFRPTPQSSGDDQLYLAEVVCMGIEPVNLVAGEMDGIRRIDRELNVGTLSAEDLIDAGGDLYVVFNNCRMTNREHWFALKVSP